MLYNEITLFQTKQLFCKSIGTKSTKIIKINYGASQTKRNQALKCNLLKAFEDVEKIYQHTGEINVKPKTIAIMKKLRASNEVFQKHKNINILDIQNLLKFFYIFGIQQR